MEKHKTSLQKAFSFLFLTLTLSACASYRPVLDENPKYMKVGEARAERDIDLCLRRADGYLAKHKDERMWKNMGRSAVGGAAIGGVIGAVSGKSVGSAVGGAALGAGAMAGTTYLGEKSKDSTTPDDMKQQYVTNCLQRQHYQVIGWK